MKIEWTNNEPPEDGYYYIKDDEFEEILIMEYASNQCYFTGIRDAYTWENLVSNGKHRSVEPVEIPDTSND